MENNLLASNELYTNVKTADSMCRIPSRIPIRSALCSELEFKAEIERDILELGL
jgi:hypothetical protein